MFLSVKRGVELAKRRKNEQFIEYTKKHTLYRNFSFLDKKLIINSQYKLTYNVQK